MRTSCVFGRLPAEEILAQTPAGLLSFPVENGERVPGRYLIIPRIHTITRLELPRDWTQTENELMLQIPEFTGIPLTEWPDYWYYMNYGEQAGQTLEHLHFHVVLRPTGRYSSRMGPALLAARYDAEMNDSWLRTAGRVDKTT